MEMCSKLKHIENVVYKKTSDYWSYADLVNFLDNNSYDYYAAGDNVDDEDAEIEHHITVKEDDLEQTAILTTRMRKHPEREYFQEQIDSGEYSTEEYLMFEILDFELEENDA